jgi:hypothetical protein
MEKMSFKLMSLAVGAVVLTGILANSAFVLAQTPQSSASNTNTTNNANNSTAIGTPVGENNTTNTSTVQLSCGPQSNTTAGAAAAENATATASNSSATSPSSNNTSAGSADSNSTTTTSGTANSTIDTILITIGEARTHILQGCDAANNGDTQMILFHFNEVARALDNIEGNLTITNSATVDNGTEHSSSTQSNGQQNTTGSSQGSATSSPPVGADQ